MVVYVTNQITDGRNDPLDIVVIPKVGLDEEFGVTIWASVRLVKDHLASVGARQFTNLDSSLADDVPNRWAIDPDECASTLNLL